MRIYIGCFGSGLGHATRMLGIAGLLKRRGAEVVFSSSGEVADFIERKGYRCNRLPLADVKYNESGELSLRRTMTASPLILARTYKQVGMELVNMKRFRPDVVLSDSVVSTVIAGRLSGARTYSVLNQLNLAARAGEMGLASLLLSEGTTAGMAKFWNLSDRVLVPDLPPPFTVSESNLRNGKVRRPEFIGFLVETGSRAPDEVAMGFSRDPRPKILWQVSGPPDTREPLVRKAREIVASLSAEYAIVLTDGMPTGSTKPVRTGGWWEYEWCDQSAFYFSACDIVVSRAGHGTVAQAMLNAKPALLIPIPRQTEQEGNASKAVRLGMALKMDQEGLTAESFRSSVERLMSEPFTSRSRELGNVAARYDAAGEILRIVGTS